MSASEYAQMVAAVLGEAGLAAAIVGIGLALCRMQVNGPCRMCLGLLVAWRLSVVASMSSGAPDGPYFIGLLFAFVFLYVIQHLARVVWELQMRGGRGMVRGSVAAEGRGD